MSEVSGDDALTPALRDALDEIDQRPGIELSGPRLALATKLRARGLVEAFVQPIDADHADEVRGWRTRDAGRAALGRGLTAETRARIETEIVGLLHASRDCLRNQGEDTSRSTFSNKDSYYAEAFGLLRGLRVLGLGDFGPVNEPGNFSHWMQQLEARVLAEENYGGSNECEFCLKRWGKDGAGRKRAYVERSASTK